VPTPETAPVPRWFADLLTHELGAWISLSSEQIHQLHAHYRLLVEWNRRMNLTSIKPGPEMIIRHYCESLFFAANLPAASVTLAVLDLGSGGGFPGVPTAILRPEWHLNLIESSQRKAVFLRESTRALSNVIVLAKRAEDVLIQGDWLVARAVNPLEVLENVPRLAPRIGLMLGEDDFPGVRQHPNIAWAAPVRLPWGDRRLCVYGEFSALQQERST
jgi:16S rRNA (guanine527-N7)-methyltransferase